MSEWLLQLTPEARALVRGEIKEHAELITAGGNANSHTITLFMLEEIVRVRKQLEDLQNAYDRLNPGSSVRRP